MPPPQTLKKATTKLKKLQASIYRGLSNILLAQKADTITYHGTLEILGRCIVHVKTATNPTHVQQLRNLEYFEGLGGEYGWCYADGAGYACCE